MKWIGRCKIGKVKAGENLFYPQIRLPKVLYELIGKEVGVWEVKTNKGISILLTPEVTDSNVQILVQETAKSVQEVQANVHYFELENRMSKLENKIEQLYKLISGKGEQIDENRAEHWARPDSNRGPPPCQGASNPPATHNNGIKSILLNYNKDELDAYTEKRLSGVADKTRNWIETASQTFWEQTQGVINLETINRLYNYTLEKWNSRDSWSKVLSFAKAFLEYLAKTHFDQRFQAFDLFLEMPKNIKERKRTTDRVITEDDIKNVIKKIVKSWRNGNLDYERALNYVCQTLFGAYTGQRPESTISKLRVDQFKDVKNGNPVIQVEANQDKIRMEHYVPLHPKLMPFLRRLAEIRNGKETMFEYMSYQQWIKRNKIPLERNDLIKDEKKRHFVTGDLRKFAEQIGDIIKWDSSNRNYILTHGVSEVNWEHYKNPLPEFVYKNYIDSWKNVDLVPEEAYELLEV